eukprot:403354131
MSINSNHLAWKDRLKKERVGVANSMTKAIFLDIVGSVQVDASESKKIFTNPYQNQIYNSKGFKKQPQQNNNQEDLSPSARKAKYLEYLIQQRRFQGESPSVETNNGNGNGSSQLNLSLMQSSANLSHLASKEGRGTEESSQKQSSYHSHNKSMDDGRYNRYKNRNNSNNNLLSYTNSSNLSLAEYQMQTNPLPIELRSSSRNILPPVQKTSYYLAHSVDLSHPDRFVNIKINNRLDRDEIYYDNKKDDRKIQNRSLSPDEMKEVTIKNLNTIDVHNIQGYDKRNMGYSKDMPYKIGLYDNSNSKDKSTMNSGLRTISTNSQLEDIYQLKSQNQATIDTQLSNNLPIIKSSSQMTIPNPDQLMQRLEQDVVGTLQHKDSMTGVLHPIRKDQSVNRIMNNSQNSKLEQKIQKQVSLSKLGQMSDNQKHLISKYRKRNQSLLSGNIKKYVYSQNRQVIAKDVNKTVML